MTKWSEHVKKHAKKHKMSYREASMNSKCKESYRKMSKKRMSPRKMSKKRMSPRKKGNPRRMNAPDDEIDLEWIVVSNDYKGGFTPDDWEPEQVDEIVGIFDSEQEATEEAKRLNDFEDSVHEGPGESEPFTESKVYGPFTKGIYKVGDKYED